MTRNAYNRRSLASLITVDVLKRLHQRQEDVKSIAFEDLLRTKATHKLLRFSTGYQPPSLNGAFRKLMLESGLEKSEQGQTSTLYSLCHTYATLQLLNNSTDIHALSKQMGNSAATMAADRLA